MRFPSISEEQQTERKLLMPVGPVMRVTPAEQPWRTRRPTVRMPIDQQESMQQRSSPWQVLTRMIAQWGLRPMLPGNWRDRTCNRPRGATCLTMLLNFPGNPADRADQAMSLSLEAIQTDLSKDR